MEKISAKEVQQLIATKRALRAYPRKGIIVVSGFKRYQADKKAILAAQTA